jgi:pimeloyl-ACP methyl ester carboxylesterase
MGVPERPIDVHGYRGQFVALGAGPPLVLLASQLVLARTYRDTAKRLGRSFRVVVLEMPGSGRAARLPVPWGASEYVHWLVGCLDALRIGPATVIGHSCSGAVALALAVHHPDRVGRLVLADTIGAGGPHSLLRVLAARGLDCIVELNLTARAWPHVAQNLLTHPRNFAYQTWLAARTDLGRTAAQVRVPTLIGWGARAHTYPPRCAAALHVHVPHARLYVSAEGCHDWIVDRPEEFSTVVERFVCEPTPSP